MQVFGIVGWKNAGKTELMVKLVEHFTETGLRVSTIKHAHHAFDVDIPGKDSYRHREAGAREVIVASENRYALMHDHRGAPEPDLDILLGKLDPVPLVLVEGFKHQGHPKLEVVRGDGPDPAIVLSDKSVVAVATDRQRDGIGVPQFDVNDVQAIAGFILQVTGLAEADILNQERH